MSAAHVANSVLFSKAYVVFYAVMLLLNVVLFVLMVLCYREHSNLYRFALHNSGNDTMDMAAFMLEIAINLALVVEVTLKLMSVGVAFFQTRANIFDFVVCVLSVSTLVVFYRGFAASLELVGDIFVTVLLVVRYLLQFLRLIVLLRNQNLATRWQTSETTIDLSTARPLGDETDDELAIPRRR